VKKLLVLLIVLLSIAPAYAHPGATDSKGGHTDRSTGKYHYHHGYSAHQHENGVCPYDFDDKTGQNSGTSSGSSSYSYGNIASVSWYDDYIDERDKRFEAEEELSALRRENHRLIEHNRNSMVFSALGGLAAGLFSLFISNRNHQKRLESENSKWEERLKIVTEQNSRLLSENKETKKQLNELSPVMESKALSDLKRKLEIRSLTTSVAICEDNPSFYHSLKSPCLAAYGHRYKSANAIESIKAGIKPCPFCHPITLNEAMEIERDELIDDSETLAAENWITVERDRIKHRTVDKMRKREERMAAIEIAIMDQETLPGVGLNFDLGVVYISRTASDGYYHHLQSCDTLKDPILVTKKGISRLLLDPCPVCSSFLAPLPDELVEVSESKNAYCYHAKGVFCVVNSKSIMLSTAKSYGYKPCSKCRPPENSPKIWF